MKSDMIVCDPQVLMGKPVVRGTRITVELILEKLAAGQSEEQLLRAHQRLTREGVWRRLGLRWKPCAPMLSTRSNARRREAGRG